MKVLAAALDVDDFDATPISSRMPSASPTHARSVEKHLMMPTNASLAFSA
eukprot:CAMPEP_0178449736 /NCGR_PEP_ID=MMETSP0689_2-20121128/42730_1 /TAXON_ID=160604 /ORGANISM="Amphidinium massartii, Strain CS-259" /LENGTH=49 /DNA_ID= /DNA_START= /DNA_END= /DNA_ORIENTATION=